MLEVVANTTQDKEYGRIGDIQVELSRRSLGAAVLGLTIKTNCGSFLLHSERFPVEL